MDQQGKQEKQEKQRKRRAFFIQNGTGFYVASDGKTFVDKDGYKVSNPKKAEIISSIASRAIDTIKENKSEIKINDKREVEKLVMDILKRFYNGWHAINELITSIRLKIFAIKWRKIVAAKKLLGLRRRRVSINTDANTTTIVKNYDQQFTYIHK